MHFFKKFHIIKPLADKRQILAQTEASKATMILLNIAFSSVLHVYSFRLRFANLTQIHTIRENT